MVSGYFTAPLKGAYLFSFTTHGGVYHASGARLLRNGRVQASTYKKQGQEEPSSQTVALSLDAGDAVSLITRGRDNQVYDNRENFCTFTGFLLFPL